jgi:hypothetical protein
MLCEVLRVSINNNYCILQYICMLKAAGRAYTAFGYNTVYNILIYTVLLYCSTARLQVDTSHPLYRS